MEESKSLAAKEYPLGTKLQVKYGKGRTEKVYDAKVCTPSKMLFFTLSMKCVKTSSANCLIYFYFFR